MLMTPGLAFFYGGLVGRKNVLADHDPELRLDGLDHGALVRLRLFAVLLGPTLGGVIGEPRHGLPARRDAADAFAGNDAGIPLIVHIAYQMMFAIITPALITGAFANRVTFKAYFLFLTALAALRLLPVRAHDLGRRHPAEVGRAGLRRRHRRAQHRRHRRAGLGALSSAGAAVMEHGPAQHAAGRARAPACCGSAGTASTPAASSASTR